MLRITKNEDELEIKNVICFFVSDTVPESIDEVKKKKEEDWTYQDYLTVSCDNHKYNLFWFNKKYVNYRLVDGVIDINDDKSDVHISLTKDNIKDTIIFQGQANDEPGSNYEGLMRAFEYMHFYMLNTFDEIRIASDKMLSANLLSAHNIPQPNYVLVTKKIMQDDALQSDPTRESFWKLLDKLYDANNDINDEYETKYVVKILGGSLGIGVFICNRNEIESILQTIFVLDEERELIIQQFKKNTGDIRAHAFSVDGKKYEIVACMKRNKIDGDFRSNVSLGASTQEIDLTDEQKEIILNTARVSGCRWVGVDLMDCEDGSQVVIEYNSSPGVQGISQQIKQNMFDIILDKITEYFKKNKWTDDKNTIHSVKNVTYFTEYNHDIIENLKDEWEILSEDRQKILNKCLEFHPGLHYTLHGKGPIYGFDCSGFVYWVVKDSLNIILPKMCVDYFTILQENNFEQIKRKDLKPGDIGVLNDSTKYNHCGIYAGQDKWFETNLAYGLQLSDFSKFKYFFRVKNIDN